MLGVGVEVGACGGGGGGGVVFGASPFFESFFFNF